MKCKKALIWSLIHGKKHETLKEEDTTIEAVTPLVSTLFPGINYYSVTGFTQVLRDCVVPALKNKFPKLLSIRESEVGPRAVVEVAEILCSKGYEWQTSARWMSRFKKLLAVA